MLVAPGAHCSVVPRLPSSLVFFLLDTGSRSDEPSPTCRGSANCFQNISFQPPSVLPRGIRSPTSQVCKLRLLEANLLPEVTYLGRCLQTPIACYPKPINYNLTNLRFSILPASSFFSFSNSSNPSSILIFPPHLLPFTVKCVKNKTLEREQLSPVQGKTGSNVNAKTIFFCVCVCVPEDMVAEGSERRT